MSQRTSDNRKSQNPSKSLIIDEEPSFILEPPSEEEKQQRASILSDLHDEPHSSGLDAYFKRLEEGSPMWDIDTFIEGAKTIARICGPERKSYFGNVLQGVHYLNRFVQLWNQEYPQLSITLSEQKIRFQCPPSWSYDFKEPGQTWSLTFKGEVPFSQGLNELMRGPTSFDCGQSQQFMFWMTIRYVVGDRVVDVLFKFAKGQFTLTRDCYRPNTPDLGGNWLFPFFDHAFNTRRSTTPRSRVQIKAIFNHSTYLSKHPGGGFRLHNGIEIDGCYVIFDPDAPRNMLSATELDRRLLEAYNSPRDFADAETLFIWEVLPALVHPDYAPKSYGALAEEARNFEHHILSETEWRNSLAAREEKARQFHLEFNFERLKSSVDETIKAYRNGDFSEDVFSRAKRKKVQGLISMYSK